MIWTTCQPKSDLNGLRMSPGFRPGFRTASLNSWTKFVLLSTQPSLPPVPVSPWEAASSLLSRAYWSNFEGSLTRSL